MTEQRHLFETPVTPETTRNQKFEPEVASRRRNSTYNTISTTSTITRSRAFPENVPDTDDAKITELRQIRDAYRSAIGERITAQVALFIEQLMTEGMEAQVIIHAIDATAWARRPSPQYLRAVLNRYRDSGITTEAQLVQEELLYQERARTGYRPWYADDLPY